LAGYVASTESVAGFLPVRLQKMTNAVGGPYFIDCFSGGKHLFLLCFPHPEHEPDRQSGAAFYRDEAVPRVQAKLCGRDVEFLS
jgi:hypothetical protein